MMQPTPQSPNTPADASRIVVAALAAVIALELVSVGWLIQGPLREYRNAERAVTINKATEHLVSATVDLAYERGRTRVVLQRREPMHAEDAKFIEERRSRGDASLAAALTAWPKDGPAYVPPRLDAVADSHAAVVRSRKENDAAAARPREARDLQLEQRWFATASRLLHDIEALMGDALLDPAVHDTRVHELLEIKLESLRMREAAGAELSHLATIITRGTLLRGDERDRLLAVRLRALFSWEHVQRLATNAAPQIKSAVERVRREYVDEFGTLRDRILASAASGAPYPLSVDQYTAHTVLALDSIGDLVGTTAAVAEERSRAHQRHARNVMALYALVASLATGLVVWLAHFVYRNFRVPLERLNRTLAGGEIALWDADVASGTVHLSKEWAMILGELPHETDTTVGALKKIIHPADRKAVLRTARTAIIEKVQTYRVEHRVRNAAGRWIWVRSEGRVVELDSKGRARRMSGVNIRIHERKQAEEALRRERERYRKIIEQAPDAIFINRDETIAYANPAALRLLGAESPAQLVGSSIFRFLHPDYHAEAHANIAARTINGGKADFFERRYIRLDGTVIDLEMSGVLIVDEAGPARLIVARDSSARKRVERERREMRVFLDSLVENIPHMVFVKDAATLRFVRLNRAAEELLGLDRAEMLGKSDYDFFPREQADFFLSRDRATLKGEEIVDIPEEPIQTRRRGLRYLHTKKIPIRDAQDEPRYLLGISEDITERKAASEALRASEGRLNAIMEHSTALIALYDAHGRYLMANRAYAEVFDMPLVSIAGKRAADVLPDTLAQAVAVEHAKVLATGMPSTSEAAVEGPAGTRAFVSMRFPLFGADGAVYAVGEISTDITQRQRDADMLRLMNEALAERASELAAANMQLESFSYSVSHDLRAPLRHIGSFATLLEQRCADQLDDHGRRYLEQIRNAVRRMGRLIEGLLEFARTGRAELARAAVDLDTLVRDVVRDMEPVIATRQIDWTYIALPVISGDPGLLRVVFANLIDNAVKYTAPRQQAKIDIGSQGMHDGEVVLYVRDNGVGFDAASTADVFAAFQRLHSDREFEGAGVGLATVKQIVQRHGGRVWAQSKVGEGATFFLALPVPDAGTVAKTRASAGM